MYYALSVALGIGVMFSVGVGWLCWWQLSKAQAMRAKLDDEMIQTQAANNVKGAFLATMSHEIRTPLNGVVGASALLQEEDMPPQQAEMVDIIRSSSDNLLAIIDDILDFSRYQSGSINFDMTAFSLTELIDDCVFKARCQVDPRNVQVVGNVVQPCPAIIYSDLKCVRQIIVNLLGNALRFTSQERLH